MRRYFLAVALLLSLGSPAAANRLTADRYDVTIRTLADGSIQVTETMRLRFTEGTFTDINREIPLQRTDGIEVLGASMDGRVMSRGSGAGAFEARTRDSRVAVRWHFPATRGGTHEFRLSYLVRGGIRREAGGGILEWQALPTSHSYAIASSRIVLEGEGQEREPSVRTRRVGSLKTARVNGDWEIDAREIGANGWIAIAAPATLAEGVTPRWQQRAARQKAVQPWALTFAGVGLVLSLAVVLLVWRAYPPEPLVDSDAIPMVGPPAPRPPAIAAAILAGGHSMSAHVPATLLDLAARGVLSVSEAESRWKAMRRFTVRRDPSGALAPYESALLDVMFGREDTAGLSRALSRVATGGRTFHHAVNEELRRLGLIDEQRRAVRRRLFATGVALAAVSLIPLAYALLRVEEVGPWIVAIPLSLDLAGALAIVLAVTRPELSDEGFRERERWRGFKRALEEEIRSGSMGSQGSGALRYLPYVAAMGLAAPLSRAARQQGAAGGLPPWFEACTAAQRENRK